MTHLMNTTVKHNYFGEGKVIKHSQDHITVLFGTDEKEFVYPDAFKDYLSIEDSDMSEIIKKEIKEKDKLTHEKEEKSEQVDPFIITLESSYSKSIAHHPRETKKKAEVNRHIAFKCNYCDGGKSSAQIGYDGVCSDEIITYNIDKKHYVWCSDEDSPCRRYYEELITRTELDASMASSDEKAFVCYESQMLRNWKAAAGVIQTGKNRGKPLKLKGVERNSLAILTTRLPSSKEKDRIIFGAFLVDETFEGDDSEEGFVSAKSEYKIKLSMPEAMDFKYWNYYFNPYSVKNSIIDAYFESAHLGDSPKSLFASVKCNYTKCNVTNALKKINNSIYITGGQEMDHINDIIMEYQKYNPAIESSLVSKSKYLPQLENPTSLHQLIQMYFL